MYKLLSFFAVIALAACNSSDAPKVQSATSTDSSSTEKPVEKVTYPYEMDYSSQFEMADPKNAQAILTLWKDWDNGNLSNSKDNFADTVTMHFPDGSMIHASRDSMIAMSQKTRDNFSHVVSQVHAVTSLKSTDKNENWVNVWGKEVDTHKDGKMDSVELMETWRFNKDGKADLLYQYSAKYKPAKK
jgi:hypothetical protein